MSKISLAVTLAPYPSDSLVLLCASISLRNSRTARKPSSALELRASASMSALSCSSTSSATTCGRISSSSWYCLMVSRWFALRSFVRSCFSISSNSSLPSRSASLSQYSALTSAWSMMSLFAAPQCSRGLK